MSEQETNMRIAERVRCGIEINMTTRFYYITAAFAAIGLVAFVSFCLFYNGTDPMSEEAIKEKFGPWISEFLDLDYPGQYAHSVCRYREIIGFDSSGEEVPRVNNMPAYILPEEDHKRAVKKLQETLQSTTKVSVSFNVHDENFQFVEAKEYLLSYDHVLAAELCKRADLMKNSFIPVGLNVYMTPPAIVFTLHPSEVKFKVMPNGKLIYVSLGKGIQRWEGDMHHFRATLLDAQLQDGETVRSVASRLLAKNARVIRQFFSTDDRDPEDGVSEED